VIGESWAAAQVAGVVVQTGAAELMGVVWVVESHLVDVEVLQIWPDLSTKLH